MTSRRALLMRLATAQAEAVGVVLRVEDGSVLRIDNQFAAAARALAPGSAVKPLVLGALDGGARWACRRTLELGGHRLDCTHVALAAPLDVATALAASCNSWFAQAAARASAEEVRRTLLRAGAQAELARTPDELALQVLGLERVRFTPLALGQAYCRLAREAPRTMREALARAVSEGTAQLAGVEGLTIAGKTGTARNACWFAGFAPVEKPRVAVVVQLNHGRGGADAAPLARELFAWWQGSQPR